MYTEISRLDARGGSEIYPRKLSHLGLRLNVHNLGPRLRLNVHND